jgi:hypothetical protein
LSLFLHLLYIGWVFCTEVQRGKRVTHSKYKKGEKKKLLHVDISYNFRVMSRTKFTVCKWTKGNNSKIRQDRVTFFFLQSTSTYWDLSIYEVSCWYILWFQSYVPEKVQSVKINKGQKPPNQARQFYSSFPMHHYSIKSIYMYLKSFLLILLVVSELIVIFLFFGNSENNFKLLRSQTCYIKLAVRSL